MGVPDNSSISGAVIFPVKTFTAASANSRFNAQPTLPSPAEYAKGWPSAAACNVSASFSIYQLLRKKSVGNMRIRDHFFC